MVELTVALLAGLIVAMGIVALSREATNTFHEESRASAAEASLRGALDRLRADLQRAGYMSTGNIQSDPNMPVAPGQAHVTSTLAGVQNLQGIHLTSPGPVTLALSSTNSLKPDAIEIAGNMTTNDQYDVAAMPLAAPGQQLAGCQMIQLTPKSPAMYRLLAPGGGLSGANAAGELANAFQPDPNKQFLVRLVDDSGRAQFLATCNAAGGSATGISGGIPFVMVDCDQTPIKTAQSSGTVGTLTGLASGRAWVNPVQVVRWEITSAGAAKDPEPGQFAMASAASDGGTDPAKYDLVRTMLDYNLQPTAVAEVVAEYAVDLKFAFNVDTSPSVDGGQPNPALVAYAFDDTNNGTVGAQVTTAPIPRPQRIRSVRVRFATRAAQPDRTTSIAVVPNYGDTYTYRYCVLPLSGGACPSPPDGIERWARVRTVTTEVALSNQAKNFY
jgi:hypothetical protein